MWDKVKQKTSWSLPIWFLGTSWGRRSFLSWLVWFAMCWSGWNAKQEKKTVSEFWNAISKKSKVFPMNAKKIQNKHFQRIKAWNLILYLHFPFSLANFWPFLIPLGPPWVYLIFLHVVLTWIWVQNVPWRPVNDLKIFAKKGFVGTKTIWWFLRFVWGIVLPPFGGGSMISILTGASSHVFFRMGWQCLPRKKKRPYFPCLSGFLWWFIIIPA